MNEAAILLLAFNLTAQECHMSTYLMYGVINDERQCMNKSGYDMEFDKMTGEYIGWRSSGGFFVPRPQKELTTDEWNRLVDWRMGIE